MTFARKTSETLHELNCDTAIHFKRFPIILQWVPEASSHEIDKTVANNNFPGLFIRHIISLHIVGFKVLEK